VILRHDHRADFEIGSIGIQHGGAGAVLDTVVRRVTWMRVAEAVIARTA